MKERRWEGGKSNNNEDEGDAAQYHGEVYQPHTPADGGFLICKGVAEDKRYLHLPPATVAPQHIPQYVRYEQQQKREVYGLCKCHLES